MKFQILKPQNLKLHLNPTQQATVSMQEVLSAFDAADVCSRDTVPQTFELYTLNGVPDDHERTWKPEPYTLHPASYIIHPTPYTLHPTPYTLISPESFILHPATLNPKPCTRISLAHLMPPMPPAAYHQTLDPRPSLNSYQTLSRPLLNPDEYHTLKIGKNRILNFEPYQILTKYTPLKPKKINQAPNPYS
jgi:hypothetical protein